MSLKIIKAGLLDTVQDGGRYGYQHSGINPGGAMDRFAATLGNALVGKELNAPVVELHFPAAQIRFQKPAILCLTGADFEPVINGNAVAMNTPVAVNEGAVLSFRKKRSGARCYLSVLNALQLPPWLKSYSTNTKVSAGGYKGKRLEKGDEINFEPIEFTIQKEFQLLPWKYHFDETRNNEIHFVPGPEWDWVTTRSQTFFLNNSFRITPASDRMGFRLQSEALEQSNKEQLISSAVSFGTVQLLPNGQLIVLMADHQTTGGYPRLANVISTHLSKLAQLSPGEELRFVMTSLSKAEEGLVAQQKFLLGLQNTCKLKIQTWLNANRH